MPGGRKGRVWSLRCVSPRATHSPGPPSPDDQPAWALETEAWGKGPRRVPCLPSGLWRPQGPLSDLEEGPLGPSQPGPVTFSSTVTTFSPEPVWADFLRLCRLFRPGRAPSPPPACSLGP
ncbi:unnamed protein product [Rangifer tarandus platyrhynchus]|uniref:Uncharacterized protein n=2 Tax=Rangifer tarandus platyrhynchus TaxID=3082113 RepID=A0ABN8ZI66_RANTA|nr:unnamed protein product [Rangifer tarandus platyrhynchus]CAI9708643.1 unnamed protein product [Rangifer tarandus platyrhynchus]